MNILAIESASTICGAALFVEDKLKGIEEINFPRVHSEKLPVFIDKLLKDNVITVGELDGIAVSSGPGSFTGLRIGMSLAKGLAASTGIPLIPVPTLLEMNQSVGYPGDYTILLYSHKNLVFHQQFKGGEPKSDVECVAFESISSENIFGFNLEKLIQMNSANTAKPSAKYVGKLAICHFKKWAVTDFNIVVPNYITEFNIGEFKV